MIAGLATIGAAGVAGGMIGVYTARYLGDRPPTTGISRASEVLDVLASSYYRPVDPAAYTGQGVGQIIRSLHDPYTRYLTPAGRRREELADTGAYSGIGVQLARRGGAIVVRSVDAGGPAQRAGTAAGDRVLAVGGHAVTGLSVRAVARRIRGAEGTSLTLTVQTTRQRRVRRVLVRKRLVVPVVASRIIGLRGARVGYIRLTSFTTGSGDAVRARTVRILRSHPRGLVLDLRGNGGGSVAGAYAIASLFLPKGATVLRMEGRHFPATTYRTRVAPIAPRLPVVVLVDHASASASEILAAALRDHRRAMIVGERTFGKAVVQDRRPLAGGAALHLTVARYYTPSGADLNHRGVAPDVRASDPLRTARDEALDLAADIARDS